MPEPPSGQRSGIYNPGTIHTGGGNVVGGNLAITTMTSTTSKVAVAFQPITEAIKDAAPAMRPAAEATLESLKKELEKAETGEKADDSVITTLLKGLVGLVPSAVTAVVSAFANPVLGAIAGPATKGLLNELGKSSG